MMEPVSDQLLELLAETESSLQIGDSESSMARVPSALAVFSYIRITNALKNTEYQTSYFPVEELPKEAYTVAALSVLVAASLIGFLKEEGHEINFNELAINIASLYFVAFPADDKARHTSNALGTFKSIVNASSPNAKSWRDNLFQLVELYFTNSGNETHEELDSLMSRLICPLLTTIGK